MGKVAPALSHPSLDDLKASGTKVDSQNLREGVEYNLVCLFNQYTAKK